MADINLTLSIIMLNMNKLNNAIKRHRLSDSMNNMIQLYFIQKRHFKFKDMNSLRVKGWKKIYYAKGNDKKI